MIRVLDRFKVIKMTREYFQLHRRPRTSTAALLLVMVASTYLCVRMENSFSGGIIFGIGVASFIIAILGFYQVLMDARIRDFQNDFMQLARSRDVYSKKMSLLWSLNLKSNEDEGLKYLISTGIKEDPPSEHAITISNEGSWNEYFKSEKKREPLLD